MTSSFERLQLNIFLRFKLLLIVVFCFFFALLLRLWYLQILKADYFRIRSENNRIRTIYVQPPRGIIYDRNHNILVKNRPGFNVDLVLEDVVKPVETVKELASLINVPASELLPKLNDQTKRRRYEPKLLMKDVSRDIVAEVLARRYKLPGVYINVRPTREYVYGNFAAHTLGYIREITREQLDSDMYEGYLPGELVGQFGVENKYEQYLQGQRGVRAVIVDATGSRIGDAYYEPEISGHDVTLTLDKEMQAAAEKGLAESEEDKEIGNEKGAVVAISADTGEILAMASKPDFDPNMFASEIPAEIWKSLGGKEKRLSNRVAQGGYPPGSVFKIFMAYAALAEGIVGKNDRVFCPGYFTFAGRSYKCHKHSGHGSVNLEEALIQSCDVYFYTMGQRLGIDKIHQYAAMFGLGSPTKFSLVHEHPGLIPSTAWKKKSFRRKEDQKWYAGETLSVAIGQGAVVTTPLQIARGLATLVNGGKLMRPNVIKNIEGVDPVEFAPQMDSKVELKPDIVEAVEKGLTGVVSDPRGTGHRASLLKTFDINVGGKTGTAQVVSLTSRAKGEHIKDHAWFAGYAPAEKPEIVVVAMVENGGHGGVTAAPVVRQVMEAYFKKTHPMKEEPDKDTKKAQNAAD
jgi:penicillin-binding protein 2